jgi:hypothetical protein
MKTSIFDMNFTLPPMIEMTEVVKDIPQTPQNTFALLPMDCAPFP